MTGLYDIALLFDSPDGAEERVRRALELLRRIVPYDQCALLEARLGCEPHVVVAPPLGCDERTGLTATMAELFGRLVGPQNAPSSPPAGDRQIALPLIGLDCVIGLLLVRRSTGDYTVDDVRALSLVAALLAAYLTIVRARREAAEHRRQLDEARRAAADASRARDELIALLAHELEAPLRSMLSAVRALRAPTADVQGAVRSLEYELVAQQGLIDDLVARSGMSAATLRVALRVTEPAALVTAAIDGLRLEAERRSIRLEAHIDDTPMALPLDPDRISQVVSTLIGNALRFTPAGGQVVIRLDRVAGYARIQIEDSGSGLRPEQLAHVFDRVHGGAAGRVGLALVKRLVELHGGRVRASSAGAQRGATFTVELPRALALGTRPLATIEPGPLAGVRVLLVDQDPGLGDAFRAALDHHGAQVTVVGSAPAALAALAAATPDVLLMGDLAMPRAEVFELMRDLAVRSNPLATASITAYDRPEDAARARAAGFRMLVGKPVGIDALVNLVAKLAGRQIDEGSPTPAQPRQGDEPPGETPARR